MSVRASTKAVVRPFDVTPAKLKRFLAEVCRRPILWDDAAASDPASAITRMLMDADTRWYEVHDPAHDDPFTGVVWFNLVGPRTRDSHILLWQALGAPRLGAQAVARVFADDSSLWRIQAVVPSHNTLAAYYATSAGLRYEGTLADALWVGGSPVHAHVYGITRPKLRDMPTHASASRAILGVDDV